MIIQPIVEGYGEVEAFPVLLRRFVEEAQAWTVNIGRPIRSYEIGDLYEMDFRTDMSLDEYNRERNVYGNRPDLLVPPDVEAEHAKIDKADGLVFIFPNWWSDSPANSKKLVLQRVCGVFISMIAFALI